MGNGDDGQMQGAKTKRRLFGRTKSRHEYLEGKCTAEEERIAHSGQSFRENFFSFFFFE